MGSLGGQKLELPGPYPLGTPPPAGQELAQQGTAFELQRKTEDQTVGAVWTTDTPKVASLKPDHGRDSSLLPRKASLLPYWIDRVVQNKAADPKFKMRLCLLTETCMEETENVLTRQSRLTTAPPGPNASELQAFSLTQEEA